MARRRYQKGSLFFKKGSWRGRWREDVIENGRLRRIRKQITIGTKARFQTKRLAQRQFDLVLARINHAGYRPVRVSSFAAFCERWKSEVLPMREISTQRAAQWHLRRYLIPELSEKQMSEIGSQEAQELIAKMSDRVSRKTAVNIIGTLSSILKTAKSWGYISSELDWKALSFPARSEKPRRRFFSASEARSIIDLAEVKYREEPWGLFFHLAAMTGMRAGELLGLKWQDIDSAARLLYVRRKVWYGHVGAPKTQASQRVLPVPISLVERLQRYKETWRPNAEGWIFATCHGRPVMIQHVVQRKLWPKLDELKIDRCGLHAFRHTHASMLVNSGAPMTVARDQLGHTDMRLTLDVYSHVIDDARRESIERLALKLDADGRHNIDKSSYIN